MLAMNRSHIVCDARENRGWFVRDHGLHAHPPNVLRFSRAGAMPVPRQRDARRRAIKCVAADAPRRLLPLVGREPLANPLGALALNDL
jgi:hypothetical protein